MAELKQLAFSYHEIVEMLIKKEGIHEGIWGLYVKFGLSAVNIGTDNVGGTLLPAAIVPIQEIGIQQFDAISNLSVDAAVVNPRPGKKSTSKR